MAFIITITLNKSKKLRQCNKFRINFMCHILTIKKIMSFVKTKFDCTICEKGLFSVKSFFLTFIFTSLYFFGESIQQFQQGEKHSGPLKIENFIWKLLVQTLITTKEPVTWEMMTYIRHGKTAAFSQVLAG